MRPAPAILPCPPRYKLCIDWRISRGSDAVADPIGFMVSDQHINRIKRDRERVHQGAMSPQRDSTAVHTLRGEGRLGEVEQTQTFVEATHLLDEIGNPCIDIHMYTQLVWEELHACIQTLTHIN